MSIFLRYLLSHLQSLNLSYELYFIMLQLNVHSINWQDDLLKTIDLYYQDHC